MKGELRTTERVHLAHQAACRAGLRSRIALVHTLLDEVERLMPADEKPLGGIARSLAEQSAEELTQLSCQLLELARAIAQAHPPSGTVSIRPASEGGVIDAA